MVDRIGQAFIAVKNVYEKDATVFVQRLRDPNGERNADDEVSAISDDNEIHTRLLEASALTRG